MKRANNILALLGKAILTLWTPWKNHRALRFHKPLLTEANMIFHFIYQSVLEQVCDIILVNKPKGPLRKVLPSNKICGRRNFPFLPLDFVIYMGNLAITCPRGQITHWISESGKMENIWANWCHCWITELFNFKTSLSLEFSLCEVIISLIV